LNSKIKQVAPSDTGYLSADCALPGDNALPDNNTLPANNAALSDSGKTTSFFEFWPTWVMYLPVVFLWLLYAVRYRSLTAPLLANPNIALGGMVGGSKHELMSQATGLCRQAILPWIWVCVNGESTVKQAADCISRAKEKGIPLPFVCKPDTGCRGAGVKLVASESALSEIIAKYPEGAAFICQQLAAYESEVGIFYVRSPENPVGEVVSLAFKHTPSVIGDGKHTLAQLVQQDARASGLLELYRSKNSAAWFAVVPDGRRHRLLFSASHCRGAVFSDARQHITPALTQAINHIMADLPEFYYGRLDVKYSSLAALKNGRDLEIVEINGASSESIHIWDKDARFSDAIKTLLWQYRTLFRLGVYQLRQGRNAPGIVALYKAWRREKLLTRHYPETD
jgi:hypothetical protein